MFRRNLPKYVVLTPIGAHKLYALEEFFKHIARFNYKPEMVVVAPDPEILYDVLDLSDVLGELTLLVLLAEYPNVYHSHLARITKARETLREWFLKSNYEYALWLDSDILAPPELPEKLLEVALETKAVVVRNGYPGRSGVIWHGSACMLTHRYACEVGRFIVTSINGMNISEDYNFFSLIKGAEPIIKHKVKMNAIVTGNFVPVKHWMRKEEKPVDTRDILGKENENKGNIREGGNTSSKRLRVQ